MDRAAVDQAAHLTQQAKDQLANLQGPAKPTEIAQAEANLNDAIAARGKVQADLRRNETLLASGSATKQVVDQERADLASAEAKIAAAEAAVKQAQAPLGRPDEIVAQASAVEVADAALAQARWRLGQRSVASPVAGVVADVLARPGETLQAGAPVVSLLPPENIFIRFFVPEPSLAHIHPGDTVALSCDNCRDLAGVVSFVAPRAEYTPPFIYSESTRAKFVFLAEARPTPDEAALFQSRSAGDGEAAGRVAMNDLVIDVRDLRKSFGDLKVVEGLSLQVARGEICGFLGANGSGKTTTIRMLCGLLEPDGGSGRCIGYDILRQAHDIRRQVGYMTQRFSLYDDLTVFENLDFVAAVFEMPNRRAAVAEMIDHMGLGDRRDQLAGQLSGGWKQRLALAACVLHEPKLLLLDEPTPASTSRRDASSGTSFTTWRSMV